MLDFLAQWGIIGLFIASVVAGSVVPLSSEAVLVACVGALRLNPWWCLASALSGNVIGGMTCYWLGTLGNIEWVERWLHIKRAKLERAERWAKRYGSWLAFFAFLPIVGSAITVALGFMRANPWVVCLAMTMGKLIRYAIFISCTLAIV